MKTSFLLTFIFSYILNINAQTYSVNAENRYSLISDVVFTSDTTRVQAIRYSEVWNYGEVQWIENENIIKRISIKPDLMDLRLKKKDPGIYLEISTVADCDVVYTVFNNILLDTVSTDELYVFLNEGFDEYFIQSSVFKKSLYAVLIGDYFEEIPTSLKVFNENKEEIYYYGLEGFSISNMRFFEDLIVLFGGEHILILDIFNGKEEVKSFDGFQIKDIEIETDSTIFVLSDSGIIRTSLNDPQFSFDEFNMEEEVIAKDLLIRNSFIGNGFNVIIEREDGNDVILFKDDTGWQLNETLNENIFFEKLWNNNGFLIATGRVKLFEDSGMEIKGPGITTNLFLPAQDSPDIELTFGEFKQNENDQLFISISVTNQSDKPATNVHVYSADLFSYWCTSMYFDQIIPLINPGETLLVTDTFDVSSFYFDKEICFYTSGEERQFDINFTDNQICNRITTDVKNINITNKVSIFPNPTSDQAFISTEKTQLSYTLFDGSGKALFSCMNNKTIDMRNLNRGIYFVKIHLQDQIITEKIIRQ